VPNGIHADLEEALESRFDLKEAIVVDSVNNNEDQIARDLGAAAAYFLEQAIKPGEVIGISSWSAALLEMINAMHPAKSSTESKVVQILGGLGNPAAQTHATHLTQRLASLIGGSAILLPAPGITTSPEAKRVLMKESYVREAAELFDHVDMVLVGIARWNHRSCSPAAATSSPRRSRRSYRSRARLAISACSSSTRRVRP
jgi:DNA-binding transcriptional regulator LsrR (DeoR family)